MAGKHVAIYLRVSTKQQSHKSQVPDLEACAAAQAAQGATVVWYADKGSGKTTQRPGWLRLEAAMRAGKVSAVVCWRIDRLGRSAKQLTALFDELTERRINLVSLREGIDLSTPAGRMVANVIAAMAQFETECRAERVLAGQEVARAKGKRWGGSLPGKRWKVTPDQEAIIQQMHANARPTAAIARALGLSRPTVYSVIAAMHNATPAADADAQTGAA